jgi:hypothetical protein
VTSRTGLAALAAVLVLAGALVARRAWAPEEGCLDGAAGLRVCAASDMAKLPDHGPVPLEDPAFDLRQGGPIRLEAARSETVAFQLVVRRRLPTRVRVQVAGFTGPNGTTLAGRPNVRLFQQLFVRVDPGGHLWNGGGSRVLPWPDDYPDALVPFEAPCRPGQSLIEALDLVDLGRAALWVDVFVPAGQPSGLYRGALRLEAEARATVVPLELLVHRASLPARPAVDAVGEIYRPYRDEGLGPRPQSEDWPRMAHCYQQLAHQHRVVFIERADEVWGAQSSADAEAAWAAYDAAFSPALTGELFTSRHGYTGPGEGTPVAVWRPPWPQNLNGALAGPLPEAEYARYRELSQAFAEHARRRGWTGSRFFAYVFDEIDGPPDKGADVAAASAARSYLAMAHREIRRLQEAIDAGAGRGLIDHVWVSHSDPAGWEGDPELDLSGIVRLWCPNGRAASPAFLARRAALGERVWFYHDGQPHVGVHSINASGVEMRTWGVIAARYGIHGQLVWAVNFGDREDPYARPSYKREDDRFGNGTMVYPGAKLGRAGFPSAPGPIPSMRLKAWRRGLQDADLASVARAAGRGAEVDALLREIVPRALGEGRGRAAWPSDSGAWLRFHSRLLALASR